MGQIHAFLQLDPNRAPDQVAFLQGRVTVLRESGGQFWVAMDEAQVDTFLSQGFAVSTYPDADRLELGPLSYRPATETPQPPDALRAAAPRGEDPGIWIVHFVAPIDKNWLQEIALAGAEQIHTLDPFTGVFRMTSALAESVRSLAYVDSVGLFHPAYAVGLSLAGVAEPFTANSLSGLSIHLPPSDQEGNLQVRVFDGLDRQSIRPALEAAGATVVSEVPQGFALQSAADAVPAVLAVPGILCADVRMIATPCNFNAGVITGTNYVRHLGTIDFLANLDGAGEIVGVIDTGCDTGTLAGIHPDLATSVRVIRNHTNPATSAPDSYVNPAPPHQNLFHGTHVIGSICGDGSLIAALPPPAPPASPPRPVVGMAPRAALVVQGPIPHDFSDPFDFAAGVGVGMINNSWGYQPSVPPICNRYDAANSAAVDHWCFRHPDILVMFAAGNEERDANGDGAIDARNMRLHALAKNALTVGATENMRSDGGWSNDYVHFFGNIFNAVPGTTAAPGILYSISDHANDVGPFSGRGRVHISLATDTGRVKPDLVAPGTNILSLRSSLVPPTGDYTSQLPVGVPPNRYAMMLGTSMATPIATGCAALVRQFYRTRFAQMRRPLLLEGVAIPAAPPMPVFGSRPAVARHADGLVCAWITPALPGGRQNIVAVRLGRHLEPIDAVPLHLQDDVGDHAAPKIVTLGERTYLLHRHGDGKMRLSCYDRSLHLVPGFGAAGVVTLSPDARPDDGVPADLIAVGDQLACAFPTMGSNGYCFQRLRADTGAAVDNAAISLLLHDGTGPHRSLVWNGTRFAVCGVAHPGNFRLQVRQIDAAGNLHGAAPITVLDQAAEIREPCLIWDARAARYALVWCDARTVPGGEIRMQFLDANAVPWGAARILMTVPAANRMRRPHIGCHPDTGYALLWEDDTQGGHFDLYLSLLDANGQVDGRIAPAASDAANRRLVRISDTPGDTDGFAAREDDAGFVLVYQSPDEVNSDRLGVYALNLTGSGAFAAQEDPGTPLLKSGSYVTATLLEHERTALTALSAVWTGGSYYLLRLAPGAALQNNLQWVRLHADGAVDTGYAVKGIREVPSPFLILGCEMLWTGNDRLIVAVNDAITGITLYLLDAQGAPIAGFGAAGAAALQDSVAIHAGVCPQPGFFSRPAFHLVVGYGTTQGGVLQLRQQRVDSLGIRVGAAVNLARADGVAPHNWFQFVNGEARSIAIYQRVNGADTRVHCRRFQLDGTPDGAERDLGPAAGEAINGVLARRPTAVDSVHREYGAAWQYRANNAAHWEIHFSRLDRQARPMANPPGAAPPMPVGDVLGIAAATPGWSPLRDAVEPQLVCTYTHQPWANPPAVLPAGTRLPDWSPSYGLAWIGVEADGTRVLYFTVLDENGRLITVPSPPPPAGPLTAPVPAGILQVSATGTRVRAFKLVWNGRVFRLDWVEEENGHLHHKCTVVNRHANQNANAIPSAALLRATLVNGATNITPGPLPDLASGYGWGRVNLRQSLAPAHPVTLQVRDDCAIGPGRAVTYRFTLPAGTALLRVTLNWTDPPGPRLINHLHLSVRVPAPPGPGRRPEYRGNRWGTVAGQTHLSRPVANPPLAADNHEDIQTFKQVVLENPDPGVYEVEVSAAHFPADPFNQQNLQAFALVFAGTGPEVRFHQPVAAVTATAVY